jgi:hypothetical protein
LIVAGVVNWFTSASVPKLGVLCATAVTFFSYLFSCVLPAMA